MAGKYSHNESVKTNDICQVCASGKYSTATNFATPCKACPLGTFLIDPSTNGDAELHNEFTDCKNCSIGKYNPYLGHGKQCFTCASALLPATTTCDGCGPGKVRLFLLSFVLCVPCFKFFQTMLAKSSFIIDICPWKMRICLEGMCSKSTFDVAPLLRSAPLRSLSFF